MPFSVQRLVNVVNCVSDAGLADVVLGANSEELEEVELVLVVNTRTELELASRLELAVVVIGAEWVCSTAVPFSVQVER